MGLTLFTMAFGSLLLYMSAFDLILYLETIAKYKVGTAEQILNRQVIIFKEYYTNPPVYKYTDDIACAHICTTSYLINKVLDLRSIIHLL